MLLPLMGCSTFLAGECWDADALRDDLQDYVVEHLAMPARCWWLMRPAI